MVSGPATTVGQRLAVQTREAFGRLRRSMALRSVSVRADAAAVHGGGVAHEHTVCDCEGAAGHADGSPVVAPGRVAREAAGSAILVQKTIAAKLYLVSRSAVFLTVATLCAMFIASIK